MLLKSSIGTFNHAARARSLALAFGAALSCALIFLFAAPMTLARPQTSSGSSQSELVRQNMARVAASTGQLTIILHRDPGLMVELKRWIAKDATDHGQLISDSDLTDEAIFDRLEVNVTFRAVATLLVQKYGYLRPAFNPDSPLARQQELLIQERVKMAGTRGGRGASEPAPRFKSARNARVRSSAHQFRLLHAGGLQPAQPCGRNGDARQQDRIPQKSLVSKIHAAILLRMHLKVRRCWARPRAT